MFVEVNGREWSTEEAFLKYKENIRKYMPISLALENYSACNNDDTIYSDEAFKVLIYYRANKSTMTEQELLTTTSLIVDKFNELLDKIGREKFTFYDDGDVNFNWKQNMED